MNFGCREVVLTILIGSERRKSLLSGEHCKLQPPVTHRRLNMTRVHRYSICYRNKITSWSLSEVRDLKGGGGAA